MSEDTISRQAVIEINRSYHGQMPNEVNHRIWKEINELPSAQPETHEERTETHACDCIERQAVIDALRTCYDTETVTMDDGDEYINYGDAIGEIEQLPSAQPERLTDDDFETIRIHLNAYKEKLCNQHRWEEADEYQRIIDRFMAFASAQPEIIRCKDCKHHGTNGYRLNCAVFCCTMPDDGFCSCGERREDG